jgi:hypothetical protein
MTFDEAKFVIGVMFTSPTYKSVGHRNPMSNDVFSLLFQITSPSAKISVRVW